LVNHRPDQIPNPPGAVFFHDIVNPKWEERMCGVARRIENYQKLISQVMAMERAGTVRIFARATLDLIHWVSAILGT
jgi:hypothetical protein